MIKFFRKIRYNLMETGKTTKYFKYAIGEIILVVIGILIALQINNWNEHKKERTLEQEYYCLLLEELEQDQQQILNLKILAEERIISANKAILEIQKEKPDATVFGENWLLSLRLATRTFKPNDATYSDIKSSGNINIIKDRAILKAISKYFKNVHGYSETIMSNAQLGINRVDNIPNLLETGLYQANVASRYANDIFTQEIRDQLVKDLPKYINETIKPELYSAILTTGTNNRRRLELLLLIEDEVSTMLELLQQKCES